MPWGKLHFRDAGFSFALDSACHPEDKSFIFPVSEYFVTGCAWMHQPLEVSVFPWNSLVRSKCLLSWGKERHTHAEMENGLWAEAEWVERGQAALPQLVNFGNSELVMERGNKRNLSTVNKTNFKLKLQQEKFSWGVSEWSALRIAECWSGSPQEIRQFQSWKGFRISWKRSSRCAFRRTYPSMWWKNRLGDF